MRTLSLGLFLGLVFATQGCAIFVRGDTQDVTLQSTVPGVRVELDGQKVALGTVEFDRARTHVIHAEAPGYDSLEVIVYPQLNDDWLFAEQCTMWPILWLPMAIDYNTGALNDFPTPIDLKLPKSKEPVAATPSTTVPAAEVKEVKIVLKKPAQEGSSIRDYRTARSNLDDGF